MADHDLVFSLGPDCRTAWNVREWFATTRAYPFDWWITPAKAMLRMIVADFRFAVAAAHLSIVPAREGGNSVYNYRLGVLHHHDFTRVEGLVRNIAPDEVAALNAKYTTLFARLRDDVAAARRPLAIVGGRLEGWPAAGPDGSASDPSRHGAIGAEELVAGVRAALGAKVTVLVVEEGDAGMRELPGGWWASLPDTGQRQGLPSDQAYAEPVALFRAAFARVALREAAACG